MLVKSASIIKGPTMPIHLFVVLVPVWNPKSCEYDNTTQVEYSYENGILSNMNNNYPITTLPTIEDVREWIIYGMNGDILEELVG